LKAQSLLFCFLLSLSSFTWAQNYDDLIQSAMAARNQGNFSEAERILRQAYDIPPDKSEVSYLLGMVLAFQERFREALMVIDEGLAQTPNHVELRLARARVQSFQGLLQEARQTTAAVLENNPEHIEARNLAGRIAIYLRQYESARGHFEYVLSILPDELEATIGLYDVAMAEGERDQAEKWLTQAETISPNHIDVLSRRLPAQYSITPRNEILVGFDRSNFNVANFPRWMDQFAEYRRLLGNGNQIFVRGEYNQRFDDYNSQMEVGLLTGQNTSMPMELALGYSPDATFLADYRARIGTRHRLINASETHGALILTPSYHFAHFNNGNVHRFHVGTEYYLLGLNAWLNPGIGIVRDQDGIETFSWNIGAHWQVSGDLRAGFNYSEAPETENTITIDTRVSHFYLQYRLGQATVIHLNFTRNDRVDSYIRDSVNAALQLRF
jgi:YaiO family outer membrane protein